MMIEQLTKGDEISRVKEGPKTTTDRMDIDPLVVLSAKPLLVLQDRVVFLHGLETCPFTLEMRFLFSCCFEDTFIDEGGELG